MQMSLRVWKPEPNPQSEYYQIIFAEHDSKKTSLSLINSDGKGMKISEEDLYEVLDNFFKGN